VLAGFDEVDVGAHRFEGDLFPGVGEGQFLGGGHRIGLAELRRELASGIDWKLQIDSGDKGRQRIRIVGIRKEELLHIEPALVESEGKDLCGIVGIDKAIFGSWWLLPPSSLFVAAAERSRAAATSGLSSSAASTAASRVNS
jgi:hypothetical protein